MHIYACSQTQSNAREYCRTYRLAAAGLLGIVGVVGVQLLGSVSAIGTLVAIGNESVLDIGGNSYESLLDVDILLSGGLKEVDVVLLSQSLALLVGDGALLSHIALVANEDFVHIHVSVLKRKEYGAKV